ncbi:IS3 family transposase [Lysinibacillus odysseyi]|uniref:IS3 family transposase n=1 Tax=Lysinibacillus odysseyi TaxID=202611 RepID=UPI0009E00E0E|nr:IS3 family transposase [Lysinibacillus odysseyi]
MENFLGLLQQEMYYVEELLSNEELKQKIERYIHYYNKKISRYESGIIPYLYQPVSYT